MADEQIQVVDNPAELRYELGINGAQAGSAVTPSRPTSSSATHRRETDGKAIPPRTRQPV
jgi:hypothetical protein